MSLEDGVRLSRGWITNLIYEPSTKQMQLMTSVALNITFPKNITHRRLPKQTEIKNKL